MYDITEVQVQFCLVFKWSIRWIGLPGVIDMLYLWDQKGAGEKKKNISVQKINNITVLVIDAN